eukprot:750610-Hanusia_phi.AAC.1
MAWQPGARVSPIVGPGAQCPIRSASVPLPSTVTRCRPPTGNRALGRAGLTHRVIRARPRRSRTLRQSRTLDTPRLRLSAEDRTRARTEAIGCGICDSECVLKAEGCKLELATHSIESDLACRCKSRAAVPGS